MRKTFALFLVFIFSFSISNAQKEVKIGNQIWMTENLNVDKFRNGDVIPEAKTKEDWIKASAIKQPSWCYYDNNPKYGEIYGKLYNYYAVNDPRVLAPEGWHIPSDEEWSVLTDYLGGVENASTKMKNKEGWTVDANGNNKSGFNGLPGGCRHKSGRFYSLGNASGWWTSTESSAVSALFRTLGEQNVGRGDEFKENGFSVRCIKD